MPKASAVVLLSAGLDSAFNLYKASQELEVRLALTFQYGQRAAAREAERAARLADGLKIPHKVIDLTWFKDFTQTALVGDMNVPVASDVAIDDMKVSARTAQAVWVPNRNGIFLNIAAGFAEGLSCDFVIPGFNAEEAATFPDNGPDFMTALDKAFTYSTSRHVRVKCFSTDLRKTEIVAESKKIGVPLKELWPCYLGGAEWCGQCESCQRFRRAMAANGGFN
ncbi:MAG TPA: 7-cyano-7-deazaguanine synthase QueC [Bdellovibrionales bacterium]|nr:7-cyano-7-deazaguanine synthase QueC [Bdellovibrionales bacterium]